MFDFSRMYLKDYRALIMLLLQCSVHSWIRDPYEIIVEDNKLSVAIVQQNYEDKIEFIFRGATSINRIDSVVRSRQVYNDGYRYLEERTFKMENNENTEENARKFNFNVFNELSEMLSHINKIENIPLRKINDYNNR